MPQRRRRKTWIRARERESLTLQSLQMDINDLKQQIESLKTLRSILYARITNDLDPYDNSFVKTIGQYYDFMHNGFQEIMTPRSGGDPVEGRAFMAAILDQDLRWGVKQGLDGFIAMWRGLTRAFDDRFFGTTGVRVVLVRPESGRTRREVVVEADSIFAVRLGEQSAKYVFPNLAGKPDLLHLMLGRTVRSRGKLRVVFDADTHRITRLDIAVNAVEGLLPVVKDRLVLKEVLEDSALVPGYVDGLHQVTPPSSQMEGNVSSDGSHSTAADCDREAEPDCVDTAAKATATPVPSSRMNMKFILIEPAWP